MANQFLALSMFVMLLSFFIILNALSNFEDIKAKPVLNSIALTFSKSTPEEPLAPNIVESQVTSNDEGDTLDKLQKLFSAHVVGVDAHQTRLGSMMHLRIPFSRFETSLMQPTRSSAGANQRLGAPGTLLPTMISLLQTRDTDIPYRVDMVLNTKERPAQAIVDQTEQTRLDMKKISRITQRLEDNGLEKKVMSAGLDKGEEGMIDLYFSRYIPIDLALNEAADE